MSAEVLVPGAAVDGAEPTGDVFDQAATEVVEYLDEHVPMGLWMVSRHVDGQQLYLNVRDHDYGVGPGDGHDWEESYCVRMLAGRGPQIAPRAQDVPAYREAGVNDQVPIGAYVGIPLLPDDHGDAFGTICGLSPMPESPSLRDHQDLLETFAGLLGHVLRADARAAQLRRLADTHLEASERDELTGLANRRGWERRLADQRQRCRTTGEPAAVLLGDLDGLKQVNDHEGHGAGDELIRAAAASLRRAVRTETDTVARIGGDEFALLVPSTEHHELDALRDRVADQLSGDGVAMSLGAAPLSLRHGVEDCVERADALMYADKQARGRARRAGGGHASRPNAAGESAPSA